MKITSCRFERSAYRVFADRSIPFALVSGGFSLDRTSPDDKADRIEYPALEIRTAWCLDLVRRLAADETRPTWRPAGDPEIDEIRAIRKVFDYLLADLERRKADELLMLGVKRTMKTMDESPLD